MDYDDYENLSIFGCVVKSPPKCYGNVCYMRTFNKKNFFFQLKYKFFFLGQHKEDNKFFLYTSGCLNITKKHYNEIQEKVYGLRPARGQNGDETQLCEVNKLNLTKK